MRWGENASTTAGGTSRMSPESTTRSGSQRRTCSMSASPHASRIVRRERHGEGRDAELLAEREPVGVAVGADGDDARRELGVFGGFEQGAEVGSRARDEHDELQHPSSLPGARMRTV